MRPYRVILAVLTFAIIAAAQARASETWATRNTSAVTNDAGVPIFRVDGKPFYVYAGAFFYERTPRAQWLRDLTAYKRIGINTIDLYLIWNWHEPQPGVEDFTGTTNDRRDLPALLSITHELGLKTIIRPGPVIRNEWRNGGYPDWLLRRPEYNMPLHDVLEGRYPATATYQNAHADAAADEWLHNSTHLSQSTRWLKAVLRAIEPWSHDVLAVALDDDQGAYIDNDTWPAPHWHAYINRLRDAVQSTIGPRVPLFINTFQMKVTASAPVWAWGNWYQSDAEVIGDHDIGQLAFSTTLLQTQPRMPVMTSEFQAGWLQGADQISPRPAAPQNTTIALHEMLQYGAHGVVNFPLADTLNPAGWAAPWANRLYAWDAAFSLDGAETTRGLAVDAFGELLARHGSQLATMRPKSDMAIAWLPSAYDPAVMPTERIGKLAAQTIDALARCRAVARTCRLVDLQYDSIGDLARSNYLVLLDTGFKADIAAKLLRARVRTFPSVDAAVSAGAGSATGGISDAALLVDAYSKYALLDIINPSPSPRSVAQTTLHVGSKTVTIPAFTMGAQSASDFWIDSSGAKLVPIAPTPLESPAVLHPAWQAVPAAGAIAYTLDVYHDGEGAIVLDNGIARVVVVPNAGARAFLFEDERSHQNRFTTIGTARDDVQNAPTPSPRDYIAPYTHPMEAGTFNRRYVCTIRSSGSRAQVRCSYDAPDFAPQPVHFEKTFTLDPQSSSLSITVRASEPAVLISAISPQCSVRFPRSTDTHVLEAARDGYRIETLFYPANSDETVEFGL